MKEENNLKEENKLQEKKKTETWVKTTKLKFSYQESRDFLVIEDEVMNLEEKIENITKDTINFDGDLKLTDDQGRSYEPYDNAYMYYNELINYTDLAPNIKQSGYMVYNIPTDSQNYFLSVAKSGSDDGYRLFMK